MTTKNENPIKNELEPDVSIRAWDQTLITDKTLKKKLIIHNLNNLDTWNLVNKYRLLEFCLIINNTDTPGKKNKDKRKVYMKFNHDYSELQIAEQNLDKIFSGDEKNLEYFVIK